MSDPSQPPILRPASPTIASSNPTIQSANSEDDASEGLSSNRSFVFAILFGVTGALGLPMLWYSRAFTRQEKWLWSVINILYTLGLIAIAIAALKVIFNALAEFS